MPPVKPFGERIADALIEDGLLFSKQVEELLEQQKKEGTRLLKQELVRTGPDLLSHLSAARALERHLGPEPEAVAAR